MTEPPNNTPRVMSHLEVQPQGTQPAPRDPACVRILLVEDSGADADLVREFLAPPHLAQTNERITHVTTLAEALTHLRHDAWEVVLLDLGLPDGVGIDSCKTVRREAPQVPIVVLTGNDDQELALACIRAGAQDYLPKNELHTQNLRRALGYAMVRMREQSERQRADELQERLAAIVEASGDAIVSCNMDGVVTTWNHGAAHIFGHTQDEAIGCDLQELIRTTIPWSPREQAERVVPIRGKSGPSTPEEVIGLQKDGRPVVLSVVSCCLRDLRNNTTIGHAAILRDVSERKRRDDELRQRNADLLDRDRQMRALTARLNAIREQERTTISRKVHDELGQLLTGIKMDLRWISRRLTAPPDARAIAHKIEEMERLVDEVITTVQNIAVELRPSTLDALGLQAAIRDEARRFQDRTGIAASVHIDNNSLPHDDIATALFRILQELLTNVTRHARASSLRIQLNAADREWILSVTDDGVGIAEHLEPGISSLGLLGMRERAESLGGTLTIRRGQHRGTTATVRVPF